MQIHATEPTRSEGNFADFPNKQGLSIVQIPVSVSLNVLGQGVRENISSEIRLNTLIECPEIPLAGSARDCLLKGTVALENIGVKERNRTIDFSTKIEGRISFLWKGEWDLGFYSHVDNHDKNFHFKGVASLLAKLEIDEKSIIAPNLSADQMFEEAYFQLGSKVRLRGYLRKFLQPHLNSAVEKLEAEILSEPKLRKKTETILDLIIPADRT